MQREDLVFVGVCDWGGLVRGVGIPTADAEVRLKRGIGLTPSYIMTPFFEPISDRGSMIEDELVIRPDPAAHVAVEFDDASAERFYLGDILETDGKPWDCCPRDFLKRAIAALEGFGLTLHARFTQKFIYTGSGDQPVPPYSLDAFRRQGAFGETLIGALGLAGLRAASFRPEARARQFEVAVTAEPAMRAADAAVILREMTRSVAWRLGHRAIFAPLMEQNGGTGNETEIHMSLWEETTPIAYDPERPQAISERAAPFFAGILAHLPALSAFSAPSVASYFRVPPSGWASLRIDRGTRDQGAELGPEPAIAGSHYAPARQFNLAFRVADATCCPHLALGALLWAGVDGLERKLTLTDGDFAKPAPSSLRDALAALEADETAKSWWSNRAMAAYLVFKRAEIAALAGSDETTISRRYAEAY